MTPRRPGLEDRRILIHAVNQVVVNTIAALVNDLGGCFCFGCRRAILNHARQRVEGFDRGAMHLFPFRRRPLAD